jgi:hypothetical protein
MKMGYSLSVLEEMLPWEREIYVTMVIKDLMEENEKKKKQMNSA